MRAFYISIGEIISVKTQVIKDSLMFIYSIAVTVFHLIPNKKYLKNVIVILTLNKSGPENQW